MSWKYHQRQSHRMHRNFSLCSTIGLHLNKTKCSASVDHVLGHFKCTFTSVINNYHHNHFTAIFPGPPGWAGARKEFLDFMAQGKITEADTPTIRLGPTPSGLTSAHLHHPPIFSYRLDALPAAQPTVSKHWRAKALLFSWIRVNVSAVRDILLIPYLTSVGDMVSESQHNGSNAPSIRSPVVDEERMTSGHWFGLVLCVSFSALALMVGWHPACKKHPFH